MILGMVEEKVYCRSVDKHSQTHTSTSGRVHSGHDLELCREKGRGKSSRKNGRRRKRGERIR